MNENKLAAIGALCFAFLIIALVASWGVISHQMRQERSAIIHSLEKSEANAHPPLLVKSSDLAPGSYEYDNVWELRATHVTFVRPVTIGEINREKKFVGTSPAGPDYWTIVDLGPSPTIVAPGGTNIFTGLFTVTLTNGIKELSTFYPFSRKE